MFNNYWQNRIESIDTTRFFKVKMKQSFVEGSYNMRLKIRGILCWLQIRRYFSFLL
jgi:hypothetical protein